MGNFLEEKILLNWRISFWNVLLERPCNRVSGSLCFFSSIAWVYSFILIVLVLSYQKPIYASSNESLCCWRECFSTCPPMNQHFEYEKHVMVREISQASIPLIVQSPMHCIKFSHIKIAT